MRIGRSCKTIAIRIGIEHEIRIIPACQRNIVLSLRGNSAAISINSVIISKIVIAVIEDAGIKTTICDRVFVCQRTLSVSLRLNFARYILPFCLRRRKLRLVKINLRRKAAVFAVISCA